MSNRCSECGKYSHTKRTCERWHFDQLTNKYGTPYADSLIRSIRKTKPKKTLKAAAESLLELLRLGGGHVDFLDKLRGAAEDHADEAVDIIFDEEKLDLSLAEMNTLCKKAAEAEASIGQAHLSLFEIVEKFDVARRKNK